MKISSTSSSLRPASTTAAGGQARASGTGQSPAAPAGDRVQISGLSAQLSHADSDFDAAKVGAVSSAIAQGRYQVNAGTIADKMLAGLSDLAGKKS
ncbi:MAG TPA: flagellar biosynthesis anti-sigma factor FlgM [Burkholderiaceae bacterium]